MKKQEDKIFYLDGHTLTCQALDQIINQKMLIDLAQSAWNIVKKARSVLQIMIEDPNKVVYGLNTGFGNFANIVISQNQRQQLQLNLIRSHAVGVGGPASLNVVRRMIILRVNTLAKGRSGISPQNLHKIINNFNADFLPFIPQKGTVGASGDLAPLSHLVLGFLGEGKAWNQQKKQFSDAEEILKIKKLEPLLLKQKQGLALINGTQFMTSVISEDIIQAKALFESSMLVYAFAVQIFGLDHSLFSKEMIELYSQQNAAFAKNLQKISEYFDSEPSELHSERISLYANEQQPASLLDFIQAMTGVESAINFCNKTIRQEINGATDNPLIYLKEDGFKETELISAGNFHGEYVAKSADFLAMALFNFGKFSESRIQRYVNGRISKLPPFLTKDGGLNSGYMIIQYTSAALLSESKIMVKPASVDSITTSSSQEDHVSMGGYAVRKCHALLQNMAQIVGIQLLMCLQAIDLLEKKPAKRLDQFRHKIRAKIPMMHKDRYYNPQIIMAKQLVLQNLAKL